MIKENIKNREIMKLNKIFLTACAAVLALGFASCGDDDDYAPGQEVGEKVVTFKGEENKTLGLTDTEFTIQLERPAAQATEAASVPLKVVSAASVLSVPATAEFAAGETVATVTIGVSTEAEAFVDYPLILEVGGDYSGSTYKIGTSYPRLSITVHKEDYKEWGTMTYTSWYFGDTWDSPVYYSEYLGMYRSEIFSDGYPFYFKIDEKAEANPLSFCDANGVEQTDIWIGYDHPSYGSMFLRWITDYDTEFVNGKYYLVCQYRVSAGSFGTDYDNFILTKAE